MNTLLPGELNKMHLFWSLRATSHIICAMCCKDIVAPNRCSGCLRVSYCSTACQTAHWQGNHKWICKAFRAINKYDKERLKPMHQETRGWYIFSQHNLRLPHFETLYTRCDSGLFGNYLVHQPYCGKCFRTEFQLDKPSVTLRACPDCRISFECTTCAGNPSKPSLHTAENCAFLKEVVLMGAFQTKWSELQKITPIIAASQEVRTHYTPLSTTKNWKEYFTIISEYDTSSLSVDSSFQILPSHASDPTALEVWRSFKLIPGKVWRPLTVIDALEKCYPDIATRKSLNILCLNAMRPDVENITAFEGILHHFPALKNLDVTIFFDVPAGLELRGLTVPHDPVREYRFGEKTLTRTVIGGTFDTFFSSPTYTKPDISVCFYSIFFGRQQNQWMPVIQFMVKEKLKAVVTVHEESVRSQQVQIMKMLGGKFVDEGGENTWRNIVPMLDFLEPNPYEPRHRHGWYYIMGEREG